MDFRTLIFSSQLKHRLLRHILFWMAWFCVVFVSSSVGVMHVQGLAKIIQVDAVISLERILSQIPFCYFVVYYLIPTFALRRKYSASIFIFLVSLFVLYWLDYAVLRLSGPYVAAILGREPRPPDVSRILALLRVFHYSGPLVCCSLMCSLKFLKFWYLKQQENTELMRENAKAELQLLKAQVHPHFLFNTLNNIYSFTLTKSPIAADLLEKLSNILHYMILEGQKGLVPLKKELQLIEDYISLEKVRYGNRLNLRVNIEGVTENKFIAPLLMIPFVENSFKHGSSKMLTHPKVELSIRIEGDQLKFRLSNNKPGTDTQANPVNGKNGIGLKNTAKRLQLLYPDKHILTIESSDTTYFVEMTITLKEVNELSPDIPDLLPIDPPLTYANA